MSVLAIDLTTAPVIAALAVLAVAALAAVWLIPRLQARRWAASGIQGKELAELENGARGTLVQVVGGVALILTVAATWMQIADARKAANQTLRLTAQQQETERFTRAVEELGSQRLEVRLGGIYSLERVALDSPHERGRVVRGPVVQLMLAYLHRHYSLGEGFHPPPPSTPDEATRQQIANVSACQLKTPKPPDDEQAALSVVLEFPDAARRRFNLSSTDLFGVRALDADFAGGDLGYSSLRSSQLERAHFDRARLRNTDLNFACLRGATFKGADLGGASLMGADISGADLSRAIRLEKPQIAWATKDRCTRLPWRRSAPVQCTRR